MKANRALVSVLTLAPVLVLAACTPPAVVPTPVPQPAPAPRPLPPAPLPPLSSDWRDAPATPGDWTWGVEDGRSAARFSGGLAFVCDRQGGRILLYRQGTPQAPPATAPGGDRPLTIHTQTVTRQVTGSPARFGDAAAVAVQFAPNDSLLDAMAFSRGRFAVRVPGLPTLFVPSWPEISRVIEDCR